MPPESIPAANAFYIDDGDSGDTAFGNVLEHNVLVACKTPVSLTGKPEQFKHSTPAASGSAFDSHTDMRKSNP